MADKSQMIQDLTPEEREEILVDIARILENTALEAVVEGEQQFAQLSTSMAEAIRLNADELARDNPENAERVLAEANSMIAQFNAVHPHRIVSRAIH